MNPGAGTQLEWDEVRAPAAFVWSLSNGGFPVIYRPPSRRSSAGRTSKAIMSAW